MTQLEVIPAVDLLGAELVRLEQGDFGRVSQKTHPGWSQGAVAAAVRRTATPVACPAVWPADDVRQCTGGAGNTSFFGAGMVNALNASSL